MAKSRQVNTKFWSDPFIMDLTGEEKLLFLYLLTNDQVSICGIYEIDIRLIVFQVGIEKEKVLSILEKFYKANKIAMFSGWIAIKNFQKYQNTKNSSIQEAIRNGMKVAPTQLISWVEGGENIQKNEVVDERGTSGIPVVDERGTSACTLLNLTLLNSTLPNLTLLDGKNTENEEKIIEEKKEEEVSVTESPTHKGISFTEFIEVVNAKGEQCDYLVERYKVQRNDLDKYMIMRQFNFFIEYWSEKSPNGKKERWQKETVFDVSRRLTTWFNRVRLSEIDLQEMEKAKVQRTLEYNKKIFDDQNNNA